MMNVPPTIVTDDSFGPEVLESPTPVLVEFKADWSGPSHIMEPVMDRISRHCGGRCKVCIIDVDTSKEIVRQYGVTTVPTILVFKAGAVVARIDGAVSTRELEKKTDQVLASDHDCSRSDG